MKKTVKIVSLLLIAAMVFSALACGEVGFRMVSSYEEVQQRFNFDAAPGVVYPDLSALNFDPATVEYKLWPYRVGDYDAKNKESAVSDYVIYGDSTIGGANVDLSFRCCKELLDAQNIKDPIVYKDVEIAELDSEYESCFGASCIAAVNGYEYTIGALYDSGKLLDSSAREELYTKLREKMRSFICSIIDEAISENGE